MDELLGSPADPPPYEEPKVTDTTHMVITAAVKERRRLFFSSFLLYTLSLQPWSASGLDINTAVCIRVSACVVAGMLGCNVGCLSVS